MNCVGVKWVLVAAVLLPTIGCQTSLGRKDAAHVVLFVPGASGDGPWYDDVRRGIVDQCPDTRVQTVAWGAPLPLFALNFSNNSIHESAEKKLAQVIGDQDKPVSIVAHSAGCGVALGALARLDRTTRVRTVVLLAPSVSPKYDLTSAIERTDGQVHVFHSDRDTLFLSWRTSNFGTYDNVKTKAAGNAGFDLSGLSPERAKRVAQHAYDPEWESLGNDGSHDGMLTRGSTDALIVPLLNGEATRVAPASPSAAIDP